MKEKKIKILVITIVVLSVLLSLACGYICYDKFFAKSDDNKINLENSSVKCEKPNKEEKEENKIVNETVKQEYNKSEILAKEEPSYIVLDEKTDQYMVLMKDKKQYLIAKSDNTWIEVDSVETTDLAYNVIGLKNDVLYYVDHTGYIVAKDLKDKSEYSGGNRYGTDYTTSWNYHSGYFTDDYLYLQFHDEMYVDSYAILEFSIKDGYLTNTHEDVIDVMTVDNGPVSFYVENNKIYYVEEYNNCDTSLKVFDIKTRETKDLKKNVCGLYRVKDKVVISRNDNTQYYLFDLKTLEEQHIINAKSADFNDDAIYFEVDNKIYFYDGRDISVGYDGPLAIKVADGTIGYADDFNLYYLNNNKIYSHNGITSKLLYSADKSVNIVYYSVLGNKQLQIFTKDGSINVVNGEKVSNSELKSSFPTYDVYNRSTKKMASYKVLSGAYYEE